MLRRGLALGAALVVLIIIVLGVKGCLDARANRELSDYARNAGQIVNETQQTSKGFFGKLEDPGTLSVTDFVNEVKADRSAMDNYVSRIDGLGSPGDMGQAQRNLELVYELRGSAMTEIANKMSSALAAEGSARAIGAIAKQMEKLVAADVLYETVVRPEIDSVLAAAGISGSDAPKGRFVPSNKWLEEDEIAAALASIEGSSAGSATPGVHGLGLIGVSINETELAEGAPAVISAEETVEVEVQVQNQGESAENGVSVSVSVGGSTLEGDISSIEAGEIATATIPLTPTPKGEQTLEVKVAPVAGEKVTENNEATYTVTFE